MRSITVDLGERSYPIYIGSGLLQSIGERCTEAGFAQRSPLLVVSDTEVAPRYLEQVETSLRSSGYTVVSHVIQAGEASKSLAVYEEVITTAIQGGLDRRLSRAGAWRGSRWRSGRLRCCILYAGNRVHADSNDHTRP